ncbi:MAG: 3-phosphoshikimate 1-carboxyvinyltransferase [Flavobacteriales bacterium]
MAITLSHSNKSLTGNIELTSSKSISNRVLMIKALSGLNIGIKNLAEAKDTQTLVKLLANNSTTFDVGHAGTVMRFLTAFLAIKEGEFVLTGSHRMQERPIKILVDALKTLGADITYLKNEGYPPLKIKSKKLIGGVVEIDGAVSSQYISALMLVAPYLEKGLTIKFLGEITSKPYLEMTIQIMRYFGAELSWNKTGVEIKPIKYIAKDFFVEADWSAASYWYGMVALADQADVTLYGLQQNSLQGDAVVQKIYEQFGINTEFIENGIRLTKASNFQLPTSNFVLDFTNCPDIAQTVAVTCAALNMSAKFTGLHTLRIKETDRIAALQTELTKLNYSVEVEGDDLIVSPLRHSCESRNLAIKTYDDHRMAMAFAPLGLLYPITIEDENVVVKSYPNFWGDLKSVNFNCKFLQ